MTTVELRITATAGSYEILASAGGWTSRPRALRRGSTYRYPLPPLTESRTWAGAAHAELCNGPDDREILRLHKRVMLADPTEEDFKQFSAWLFATLMGPMWAEIEQQFPAGDLQLNVTCEGEAIRMQGLPWEMMTLDGRPIIAHVARGVSISRLVNSGPITAPAALELPLRVLFIVAEMDEALRPGAEYLGMLQGLDVSVDAHAHAATSSLIVRSLVEPTAEIIEQAITTFRPQVVHIVAHGTREADTSAIRLVRKDRDRHLIADPCSPQRLLDLMRGLKRDVTLPVLCLINACHSAEAGEPGDPRSFAAELVKGGVAAAVGMAGEVASHACRLFTKALYRGLLSRRSIAQAVADGQFASRLYYDRTGSNVEWARPSLFTARGVQIEFSTNLAQQRLLDAARSFNGRGTQTFDRYRALHTCQRFLEEIQRRVPGSNKVLAFHQKLEDPFEFRGIKYAYQMGKSHLLNELARHAMLNGFLPCLLPRTKGHTPKPNLLLFALRLAEVMDDLRAAFQLPKRHNSAAHRLALGPVASAATIADRDLERFWVALDDAKWRLQDAIGTGRDEVDIHRIKHVIGEDAASLLDDVRRVCPMARDVLVLIDDLHAYKGCCELLLECVDDFGLGTAKAAVPLIVTYSSKRESGLELETILSDGARAVARRSQCVALEPFLQDVEGRLAYTQYLLSIGIAPSRRIATPLLEVRDKLVQQVLHQTNGSPALLKLTRDYVELGINTGLFVAANDEDIFRQLTARQNANQLGASHE